MLTSLVAFNYLAPFSVLGFAALDYKGIEGTVDRWFDFNHHANVVQPTKPVPELPGAVFFVIGGISLVSRRRK